MRVSSATMPTALMIAAPRSGSGKTTLTLGLLAALRSRGQPVRAAKCGPDYIDPAFHAAATGTPSVNLDSWSMPRGLMEGLVAGLVSDATDTPLVVVEAAMGLFDGAGAPGPGGDDGSAASVARILGIPVVLVIDVSGQAQSAAGVAHGFATLDPDITVAGTVLNRTASDRHACRARAAIEATGLPVFGALPHSQATSLPERHLGLVQAAETTSLRGFLSDLGRFAATHLDIGAIAAVGRPIRARSPAIGANCGIAPPGQRIAIASDEAFAFAYPHLLSSWRAAGAEIVGFSPLADQPPDPYADAIWLPGGYPELHAPRLAGATRFLAGLRASPAAIHGECGGYMMLGQGLTDAHGERHRMAGLLSHETSFAERHLSLGYRSATLHRDCALGRKGTVVAGHEFHYATEAISRRSDLALAELRDGEGRAIGPVGGWAVSPAGGVVSGSFFHAIAASN